MKLICFLYLQRGFPLGGPERRLRIDFADSGQPPAPFKGKAPYEGGGEYRKIPEYEYPEGVPPPFEEPHVHHPPVPHHPYGYVPR